MTQQNHSNEVTLTVRGRIGACEVEASLRVQPSEVKSRLKSILEELTEIGVEPAVTETAGDGERRAESKRRDTSPPGDDAFSRLAREVEALPEDLRRVLGFKGDSIQIYRAGQLPISDAVSILCLAYEKGLGKPGVDYETFTSLLAANHIKMKTPMSTLCFNLIRDGYIEKKAYEDGRTILLTPGGERKATEALQAVLSGTPRPRRATRKRSIKSKTARVARKRGERPA